MKQVSKLFDGECRKSLTMFRCDFTQQTPHIPKYHAFPHGLSAIAQAVGKIRRHHNTDASRGAIHQLGPRLGEIFRSGDPTDRSLQIEVDLKPARPGSWPSRPTGHFTQRLDAVAEESHCAGERFCGPGRVVSLADWMFRICPTCKLPDLGVLSAGFTKGSR